MNSRNRDPRPYASSPCMAGELSSDYFGSSAVDPQQAVAERCGIVEVARCSSETGEVVVETAVNVNAVG